MPLKTIPFRSKTYLRHVASLPCAACGVTPCQAHHLLRAGGKGMGMKASDDMTIPLCVGHHWALHADGNEVKYLAQHGIDGPTEAQRIHQLWEIENGR